MDIIVKKFGGTSLSSPEQIRNVARIIVDGYKHHASTVAVGGNTSNNNHNSGGDDYSCSNDNLFSFDKSDKKIVVVVSAMAGQTNHLIDLVNRVSLFPTPREYDVVVSSGEQISCGLLAICLNDLGISAKSLMAWQVPIYTDDNHVNAKYLGIDADVIRSELKGVDVVIVPGFQGISQNERRITTIGRGGSDVTAVAVAKALDASICEIYTDVNGVYSSNPRIVKNARLIDKISYDEMLEFSSLGAKVLHPRAVSLGMDYNIPIKVLNTFDVCSNNFTYIHGRLALSDSPPSSSPSLSTEHVETNRALKEKEKSMETNKVKAVLYSNEHCLLRLRLSGDDGGVVISKIMESFGRSGILVHSFSQDNFGIGSSGEVVVSFIMPRSDGKRARNIISSRMDMSEFDVSGVELFDNHGMISLIGSNICGDSEMLSQFNHVLSEFNVIPVSFISTPTRVSIFIDEEFGELITRRMHDQFIISTVDVMDKCDKVVVSS